MQYRRIYVPGSTYFFTIVTERRRKIFTDDVNVDILRQAFRNTMKKRPFTIDAVVILPDHLHCIWTLPPNDSDFSTRWRLIKTWFTKHSNYKNQLPANESRIKKREQSIWQHRYWEHLLRNELDFEQHINYIHYNPVKHGYVTNPSDWKHSSLHLYIQLNILPANWGKQCSTLNDKMRKMKYLN